MRATLERSAARGFVGIRLVQAAYHGRSFALYLKLGFEARELLVCLQGTAAPTALPGCTVRTATADDFSACNRLCARVHGHNRGGELADAVTQGVARVVERGGRLTGYATRSPTSATRSPRRTTTSRHSSAAPSPSRGRACSCPRVTGT